MSQEENKWQINHLIENLKRNKDAVIVVGDKAVESLNLFAVNEDCKDIMNRKTMVKDPAKFWSFYQENISKQVFGKSPAEDAIEELACTGLVKTIIDLNYTGNLINSDYLDRYEDLNIIQLKGDLDVLRCMSCGKEYDAEEGLLNTETVLKCNCKGKIAPTITMFGEKYLDKNVKAVKDALFTEEEDKVKLNTHCLIFIGVNFEESYINELIDSYDAVKAELSTDEDPYFTVIITDNDSININYYRPEFATDDNIAESIKRLTAMINNID